jgi:GDP-6-deoxy-D-talose 4-dehydrogenase
MAAPRSDGQRVLLTGRSGFTGRYVADLLIASGYEVFDPEADGKSFDLTQPATLSPVIAEAQPDYVIHLAAQSFVAHDDAAAFYNVNAVGTTNLLDAILANGSIPRRIVVASSANVYGNARDDPITEQTPAAPVNHYAASKLAMEHLAATYADRLPIVVTRPFNYTGVGQAPHFVIPKLVEHFALRLRVVELGNIDVVRDFSDVRAVAHAYVRLLEAQDAAPVINLCSGAGRSLRSIIAQLAELSGHRLEVRVDPSLVRSNEVHRLVGSTQLVATTLGTLPYQDFEATLAWMLAERSKSG